LLISVHPVQIHKIVLVMYAHDTLRSISHCLMPDVWEECSNLACADANRSNRHQSPCFCGKW
jgi:hypothetical protein